MFLLFVNFGIQTALDLYGLSMYYKTCDQSSVMATLEVLWCTLPQTYTEEHGLGSAQLMVFVHAGHDDASTPTGDTSAGLNQPHDETKTSKPINVSSSNYWRDFRANLVRREQVSLVCS